MPRLHATNSEPRLQCARCGGDLAGERCPTCRARRARWIAYGIVIAIILGTAVFPAMALLLPVGVVACVRAFALTRSTVDRVLFVIGIVGLVGLLSYATLLSWMIRAFEELG